MKTLIMILMTLTSNAFASQAECIFEIRDFNKKHDDKVEIVLIDKKESGSFLFVRSKGSKSQAQQAEAMKVARVCIEAGIPNTVYLGDYGVDETKTYCQVKNPKTMAAVCDKVVDGGKKTKLIVKKLK